MKVENALQETFSTSFDLFKKQFVALIVGCLLAAIGSVFIVTFPPFYFGVFYMAWQIVQGKKVEITDVFKGFNYIIVSWILFILATIAITLGFVFLVIPGLLLTILFQYAIVVAIAEKTGAVDSLKRSFDIGKKNFVYSLVLAIIIWVVNAIGGAVQVGWIVTCPFTVLLLSVAYKKLK